MVSKPQKNKRGREEKRPTKQIPNSNKNIHIINYLKGKWIKCINQIFFMCVCVPVLKNTRLQQIYTGLFEFYL